MEDLENKTKEELIAKINSLNDNVTYWIAEYKKANTKYEGLMNLIKSITKLVE